MANITLDARQQQKHDTSTNFNNANKLYLEGEFLVETDTGKVKIGDGTLGYKSLPYTIGTRVPEGAKFTDTTYTAGTGLSLNGTSFSISNSGVTAGSYGPSQDSSVGFGDSIDVPYISVNSRGQITSADSRSITLPSEPTPTSIGAEPAFAKNTAFNKNFGSAAGTVCQGNDSRLSNARPASDVSAWAKEPNKPTYTPTEVGVIGTAPTSGQVAVFDGTTGKIKSTGFTIASSVPSGAKFTDTTYSAATSTVLGLVKVGYTESGKNYPVELDADDKMFVNVPWTDTNTTYAQATSTVLGLVKIGYAENGRNYPIKLDSLGKMFVNVPWTDTTYSVATVSEAGLIPKIPSSSAQYLNGMGQWSTPPDTKYTNFVGSGTGAKSGLVPSPGATAGTTRYLREDGTWYVPPDTTYRAGRAIEISQGAISVTNSGVSSGTYGLTTNTSVNVGTSFTVPGFVVDQHGRLTKAYSRAVTVNAPNMTGATTSEAGKAGFVPGPSAGDVYRYLRANGTWGAIPVVNSQRDGLAPKAPGDSRKFLNGSGNWATPYVADIGYDGYLPKLSGIPSTFLNGNGEWAVPPVFKGYTTGVAGTVGYVPAPTSANKFLKSDGTWADVGFSGGTVANDTTFSSNVTISGELNYDGGFY